MCVNTTEYLEAFFGAQKLGCVPVNVNYRYVGSELAYLLDNSDAVALVFHDDFASTVGDALAALPSGAGPVCSSRSRTRPRAGRRCSTAHATTTRSWHPSIRAIRRRRREPSGDDLIFLYTGGTTGYPKAVMWRSDDLYVSLWQMARPGTEPPDVTTSINAGKQAATLLPACPLMHGTGLFIALSTFSGGGSVVLLDTPRLDPEAVWTAIEREHVQVCTIVGDAFARPLLAALHAEPQRWDLSSLRAITSSGVTWSPETKRGLLAQLPNVTLIDSLGASEGIMTRTETRASDAIAPARFKAGDRLVVVTDDGEVVRPGDERIGMLGVGGPIPLGYYKDAEKTAETFRTVAGRRYSIPGDYATVDADGTIRLLGRGSACINTGGEKVYPEEVELALRSHPDVFDCVVVGVPDTRWGEMVVALVQPAGAAFGESDLAVHCRTTLAGYKVPKHFVSVDSLQRSPAGKADYKLLRRRRRRRQFREHVAGTAHPGGRRHRCERRTRAHGAPRRARGRRVGGRARARRAVGTARQPRGGPFPDPDQPSHRVRVPFGQPIGQGDGPARQWGFDAVNMAGGMKAWAARGLPVVRDDDSPGQVI